MSAESFAAPGGAGSYTTARMRSVLIDRAQARAAYDKLVSAPRAGATYIAQVAQRAGVGRAARVIGGKLAWLLGIVGTAGYGTTSIVVLTTDSGRSGLTTALGFTLKVAGLPFRVALMPLRFLSHHTGAVGRRAEGTSIASFCLVRDKVKGAWSVTMSALGKLDDNVIVQLIRSVATWKIVSRLANRWIPSLGWRIVAYVVIYSVLPDSGEGALLDRLVAGVHKLTGKVEKATEALDQTADAAVPAAPEAAPEEPSVEAPIAEEPAKAAESPAEPSEAVPAPVSEPAAETEAPAATATPSAPVVELGQGLVKRDGKRFTWQFPGDPKAEWKPVLHPTDISVTRAGGIKQVCQVHLQADGKTTVYQFGKVLFVGQLPPDVAESEVVAALAAVNDGAAPATAEDNGAPVPANRAARRQQERDEKTS